MTTRSPRPDDGAQASIVVRVGSLLIAVSVLAALLATLWFVVRTMGVRSPYWGEAEVVFEASRLRNKLPLYVDPFVGAHEYGDPPSRYYVTYPPVWTWVISRVGESGALLFGRLACTIAWFGSLATIVWTAHHGAATRRAAALGGAFVAGIWVLANFATVGRPDSIACALAAIALARSIRDKTVDDVSVALFVLVPWVKPTVIGLPIAAIVAGAVLDRERTWRTVRTAFIGFGAAFAIAHFGSNGALLMHVVRSNAQPFTLEAWLDQVPARLPFFLPLLLWALVVAWRESADRGMKIGFYALAASLSWTLLALAKTGSSSNYWMEPCIGAVVVISRAREPFPVPLRAAHVLGALGLVLWADVGSIRSAFEHADAERRDAAFLATIKSSCGVVRERADPAEDAPDVIAADEAGIELALNGRILTPTYQMVHLVKRGIYPASLWISDLESAKTRCLVEHTGQMRLDPTLAKAITDHFVLVADDSGFRVWKKKD